MTKAITYRITILIMDFVAVYLFTQKIEVALGFMLISNVYTSIAYYGHERIWNRINWGKKNKGKA